jgi:ribonucleoside-diphosphate reductase alpha chain
MAGGIENFKTKNNNVSKNRYDVYEPAFETPFKSSEISGDIITRNLEQFCELSSFLRWMPDIFWDLYRPETGGLIFDLHQRVMLRLLARFPENYFCAPRGISKTLVHILNQYHTACCFPNITTSVTASTKESAVKIWKDKHDEILRFYPTFAANIKSANFSKDSGKVEFVNGSVVDSLANSQTSKGLRRRRGGLEESALIDKETYDDAIEPIFNISRSTMTGEVDPEELNGQINRYSTSGYKNSDEYTKIITMAQSMSDLSGSFVFGSDWFLPVHFGRQKKSVIDKSRANNIIRFRQNYLCDWIGVSDGGLINISKLIKARVLDKPELECPRDKKGNYELNEYVIGCDIARSNSDNNNKTSIVVLKLVRSNKGTIRQVQVVNIINPPNGLNFDEQSIIIKRIFYQYGGNYDLTKSRVKMVIIDNNGVGQGALESLLKEITDYETNTEYPAWATVNTDDKCMDSNAPRVLFGLKAQGINSDIIRIFIDSVESNKLKLIRPYDDIRDKIPKETDDKLVDVLCFQTQQLIDEVANLKLKRSDKTNGLSVEPLVKRIDKDRYSALAYALYYIFVFMNEEIEEEVDDLEYLASYLCF